MKDALNLEVKPKKTYQLLIVAQSSGNVATSISEHDTYEASEEAFKQVRIADESLSVSSNMQYRVYRMYKK